MRSLFWCSAALLLAGCGHARAHPRDPFAYDAARPLAVRDGGIAASSTRVTLHVLSFAGSSGRIDAFLYVPRSPGPHPAVLFLHGSGGSRQDLLLPAGELALEGAVTMTISQPNDAQVFRPLVINARRALDVLVAREDVDPKRLGVVGYSLGAQTAAILAGDDPRLRAAGMIAGRGSEAPLYWIRRTHAHLSFEAGTHDQVVPHAQLVALIRAAPGSPRVRWYDTGHGMSKRAFDDENAWQAAELRIG